MKLYRGKSALVSVGRVVLGNVFQTESVSEKSKCQRFVAQTVIARERRKTYRAHSAAIS